MKQYTGEFQSTSFHDTVIKTTISKLIEVCGEPSMEQNDGRDKVNIEWEMETEDGDMFIIYDWKEDRKIGDNEQITFHIGGVGKQVTEQALVELKRELR